MPHYAESAVHQEFDCCIFQKKRLTEQYLQHKKNKTLEKMYFFFFFFDLQ